MDYHMDRVVIICIVFFLLFLVPFSFYFRQGGYVFVVVCLSVSNFAQKLPNRFA